MKATTLIEKFETYCPQELAEEGDVVGLQIGTLKKEVKTVMVTLDVRPEVVQEAIKKKVDLLLVKHPPIFRSVRQLITDVPQQKMYADLLTHGIAVYVAHTNIDIIENGLNDWFCEQLEIVATEFLTYTHTLAEKDYGLGRVGELAVPMSLQAFVEKVKDTFELEGLRVVTNDWNQQIARVAICGGSGEKFYLDALKKQADVYITGDIFYHTAQDMLAEGLSAIDPGHYIEVLFTKKITALLNQWKEELNWEVTILASQENTNPFQFK